ncbi:hypothetical protein BVX99_01805 [bacterium F16]|nr:hypothetical protein BVX99_01805 [bacterium F16]
MAQNNGQNQPLKKLDLSLAHVNKRASDDDVECVDGAKTVINPADSEASNPADNVSEQMPTVIADRYRVIQQIGKGGMGVVLLAQDERLGRYVAIKRLIFKSSNMKLVHRRFLREAQTIAALGHANIVNVFDIGQDGDVGYITMEYVPGPILNDADVPRDPPAPVTLDEYIKKKGPMEPVQAANLMLKICNAMGYAHKQGTIHRDIKPTNILLTDTMEPKVVDFGLARPIDISQTEEITLEGTMLGTPEYSAPEQWGDMKEVGIPSDIYALGGVIWFVLTGRIPRFFRENELSPDMGRIVGCCLSQRPKDRYQYADDLAKELLSVGYVPTDTSPEIPTLELSDTQKMASGTWQCMNCNNLNPESAHFCIQCGASGLHACVLCGADMRIGAQFCPSCGEDVHLAEETVSILLEAKNHANFFEFETALDDIKHLRQKNGEARELAITWQKAIDDRKGMLARLEKAVQVDNVVEAIQCAAEIKDLVPKECLSESLDFGIVVKYAELQAELRKMLIDAATKAHEEYDLQQFSTSIQALNRIFGEDVCGAVNSQLSAILGDLDQAMTNAGLALGMNCISKALEAISEIPPWKNGELGERRTRLYQNCLELKEERDQIIVDVESAVSNQEYSEALHLIAKMARFRLPPDHSELDPAQADLDANERIAKIDKVLTLNIKDNVQDWVKGNNWEDIKNAITALEQGGSKNWLDLLQRLKFSVKSEVKFRFEKATSLERKGKFRQAEAAWDMFLLIPEEFVSPTMVVEANNFKDRRSVDRLRKARYKAVNATVLLWLLFFTFSSWMIWYPLYKNQAAWDYLGQEVLGSMGLSITPGSDSTFQNNMWPAFLQLSLFIIVALGVKSRFLHRPHRTLANWSCMPRLSAFGVVAALSPLSMVLYEAYMQWVYIPHNLIFLVHPYLLVTLAWVGLDFFRGFNKHRLPANLALTVSWIVASLLLLSTRYGPDVVERTIVFPDDAMLFKLTVWPSLALVHAAVYGIIIVVEHQVYTRKYGSKIVDKRLDDATMTDRFQVRTTDL